VDNGGKEEKNRMKMALSQESDLGEFTKMLWREFYPQIKGRQGKASRLAICMLGRLYDGHELSDLVPRQVHKIGEIYSFTQWQIEYGFRGYGKNTWIALNKILGKYGFSAIQLPESYTSEK